MLTFLYQLIIMPLELMIEVIFTVMYRMLDNAGLAVIGMGIVVSFLILPLYRRADLMQEEERDRQAAMKHWVDHIRRVFKRVAMSRGGFTGKGVFGSIPYLVVLLKDGRERQCNFKYEEDVDSFLSIVRTRHPEIPTMSEKAQARMEEERAREEARYVKDLTPQAQESIEELRRAEAYLERKPEIPAFLSVTAKEKRITDRMNPWYRYAALAIFLLAVGSVLFGIYAVIHHQGYAVYFVLFGMAFIFYTMSAQVLPTGRNNRRYADARWREALRRSGKYAIICVFTSET